jgi:hypothetical protein
MVPRNALPMVSSKLISIKLNDNQISVVLSHHISKTIDTHLTHIYILAKLLHLCEPELKAPTL